MNTTIITELRLIVIKAAHVWNAEAPIKVAAGRFAVIKLVQPAKALGDDTLVTFGKLIEVKLIQPWNTVGPIDVRLGAVIVNKLLQALKAASPIVNKLGNITVVNAVQPLNPALFILVTNGALK